MAKVVNAKLNRAKLARPSRPSDFKALVAAGKSLSLRGDYEECMGCYRQALRLKKNISHEPRFVQTSFAEVLEDIAVIQARIGDPIRSIHAYHLCLEIRQRNSSGPYDPLPGMTLYNLAGVYFSIGMASEALDHLLQAQLLLGIRDDAHSFDVWVAIGAAQRHLGCSDDSISSFREALRVLECIRTSSPGMNVASKMARLTRSRGNMCCTPQELNEAVSFFASVVDESGDEEASEAETTTSTVAPAA
jgi:tetratricopeptide (TPR) repeat protein